MLKKDYVESEKKLAQKPDQTRRHLSIDYKHNQRESVLSKLLKIVFRVTRWKKKLEREMVAGKIDQTPAQLPKSIRSNFQIVESEINSQKIWQIQPKEDVSSQCILFLHGGAYVYNIIPMHWQFLEKLLIKTRATVVVPDYPLAPLANFQDVYQFVDSVYEHLLAEYSSKNLIIMGDSAGAGLALGFAQQLRNENKPLPQQLILISPWLDITMTHEGLQEIEENDFMLDIKGLRMAGEAYAGTFDTKNFKVSPLYGNLEDLPRISLFTGTHDLLFCDAEEFRNKMRTACLPLNYYEYPKMVHDWILITHLKESKQAINQISNLISSDESY